MARWNIAPTSPVLGVTTGGGGDRLLDIYRWGLVPPWAKDRSIASRLFNARAEGVSSRPAFRSAFKARRLLVPADAFYEWQRPPRSAKRAWAFWRADGAPLAFAGLWEPRRDLDQAGDQWASIPSCTILTTKAGPDLAPVHDRQPVVLDPELWGRWCDPELSDVEELTAMLAPSPTGTLVGHVVGPGVGSVANDGPGLLEPLSSS